MSLFGCWNCGTTFREHRNYRRTHTFKAAIDFPFIWILFQQFSSVFFWIWLLFLRRKFPGDFANSALLTLPPPRPFFSSSLRFLHKIFTTLFSSSCWAEIGDHLGEPRLAVDSATAGYFPNPTTDHRGSLHSRKILHLHFSLNWPKSLFFSSAVVGSCDFLFLRKFLSTHSHFVTFLPASVGAQPLLLPLDNLTREPPSARTFR